jgi:hypothetical protein
LSGHGLIRLRGSRARRLHRDGRAAAQNLIRASLKNIGNVLGSLEIGMSGPIKAGGRRGQQRDRKSSTDIGRGRAICEYIEIMQILPGSSDDALLINASRVNGNMTTA